MAAGPPKATDTATHLLPRRRFIDDMPDKGLFAGVAAVGFATIIALKVKQFSPESVSVFAVALMLIYGSIAYRMPLVRLRLDRLGDNIYYLGFIYTLASLSAALVELRSGIDSSAILGAFGIALVTTIVGIAGRVIFVQMRSEIDDVEEIIRRDILEAGTQLRGQLSAALNDFDVFRTGVQQAAKESLGNTTVYAVAHLDKISSVAQQAADRINDAFAVKQSQAQTQLDQISLLAHQAATKIEAAFADRTKTAEHLLDLSARAAAAVERLMRRVESSDLPTEKLEAQLHGFAAQLNDLVVRLGKTVDAVASDHKKRTKRLWFFSKR